MEKISLSTRLAQRACFALSCCLQVLHYDGSGGGLLTDGVLDMASASSPPSACRTPEKQALVDKMAMEGVVYMAGTDPSTQAGKVDMSQAATLNRVLTKLYPREVPVTAQALLMVLRDDQVGLGSLCFIVTGKS